jgi:hypothetical protein
MSGHIGYSANRLPYNNRERAFAEQWHKEAPHVLGRLVEDPTDRDCAVAATIIQWLGSNVGKDFVRMVHESELYKTPDTY